MSPDLLTVAETAETLRLSVSAIYKMLEEGTLPGFRIGPKNGGVRVARTDIDAYLASRKIGAEAQPEPPPRRVRLKHLRA